MRLIDADEFKKYISKMPLTNSSKEMFKHAIKSQPTAYDIDKVVEELFDDDFVRYDDDFVIPRDRAIEIVKQGLKEQK